MGVRFSPGKSRFQPHFLHSTRRVMGVKKEEIPSSMGAVRIRSVSHPA